MGRQTESSSVPQTAACWFNCQPSSSGFFHPDQLFTSILSTSSLSGGAPKHIIIIIKVFVCIRIVRMEISAQLNPLCRSWTPLNITSAPWIMTLRSAQSMVLKPKPESRWHLQDYLSQKTHTEYEIYALIFIENIWLFNKFTCRRRKSGCNFITSENTPAAATLSLRR